MNVNDRAMSRHMKRFVGWAACVCFLTLVWGGSVYASPSPPSKVPVTPSVIQSFFPALDVRIRKHLGATPVRVRSYGGNSEHAPIADARGALHVMVISDLNSSYGSTTYRSGVHDAVEEIIRRRPDVVISGGDMVAGQRHGLDYRAMWQGFHDAVTRPLEQAGIPLLVTAGNHDGPHSRQYRYQREIYKDEWNIHRPKVTFVDDTHYPEYYSVAMGPVLFISVDSSTVGSLGGSQMPWLEAQLKNAQDFPVKIVFGHVPLWAVSRGREREIIGDEALEALLERYEVDAFIAGHDHAYYPGARGNVRYIAAPALGTGPRHLLAPNQNRSPRGFLEFFAGVNGGIYDLESWRVPDFQRIDAREDLPPKVGRGRAPLVRDDLAGMDLRSDAYDQTPAISETSGAESAASESSSRTTKTMRTPQSRRESPRASKAPRASTGDENTLNQAASSSDKDKESRDRKRRPSTFDGRGGGRRALPADLFDD